MILEMKRHHRSKLLRRAHKITSSFWGDLATDPKNACLASPCSQSKS